MIQSEVKPSSNAVTKNVTNCPHKMVFFVRCNQFCNQTEGTSGQRRAMESRSLGHPGQPRATEGNQTIGLITQRSHVQIMPPQPTHSIGLRLISKHFLPVTNPPNIVISC
jgi:hypothetical protein